MFHFFPTESHVFDDSDDEYEDDRTDSIKLISELNKKIQHRRKLNAISNAPIVTVAAEQAAAECAVQVLPGKSKATAKEMPNQYNLEHVISTPEALETASNSAVRTRASNRLRNLPAEIKIPEASIIYDANGQTIEVLVEDIGGGGSGAGGSETEFIISDAIENAFDGPFQSTDSNDEEFEALMANSENQFENEQFSLQDIAKSEDLYVSEESMDEQKNLDEDVDVDDDGDDEIDEGKFVIPFSLHKTKRFNSRQLSFVDRQNIENRSILESILPTIKQSIAARNGGTVLDDQTQYKIIRANGDEIKVQCITADGTEFEVEMKQSLSTDFERDETGDLKIFSCSKCPKTFSRRGKLINHERDHNAKSTGQECPYCQKWFPSNSTLTRHIRVHTGEKPFKCQVCNRSFIQKEILKRHLMTHSGERPYKCSHCSKSFILKEALRQHINRNHTENPTPEMHNCPFCPKVCACELTGCKLTHIEICLIFHNYFPFSSFSSRSHSAIRLA